MRKEKYDNTKAKSTIKGQSRKRNRTDTDEVSVHDSVPRAHPKLDKASHRDQDFCQRAQPQGSFRQRSLVVS
jgi:hypothetical protein